MVMALGLLVVLGLLAWFTIDPSATLHVHGYQSSLVSIQDRDIELRWIPELLLGMFGFRIVMAHLRARLESRQSRES
ncbi:hypothetical protein SAMN05421819_1623 [Bryocella elongata]|uniref:Uncharacterized protein n=2 Tax=Bryocella elongata TaxID=863522 RepID=A0A1H5WKZ2_9BACT|nr:hypothetical protein SAMN05421819_1623 [Bryocella elongata]